MAKLAEKLIILEDVASGLLARVHQLMTFNPDSLFNSPELEKYKKTIAKKFPDLKDVEMRKVTGDTAFSKKAPEVTTAVADYYRTFLDVLNFKDEAWKALIEVSQQIVAFDFDLNVDLLTYYLNLISRYIHLHLLVNRVKDRKLVLGAYARAYNITSGNSEPNFHQIATFLEKYEKEDLKVLADDFTTIARRIGDTLMSFAKPIRQWLEVKTLVDKRVFNVVTDPKTMCIPAGENNHLELMHVVRMKQWVIIGFLVCPGELARDGAVDLLFDCLRDSFILPIYRDINFNIHEEYEKLFGWYKTKTFKLSKHKKRLKSFNWDEIQYTHQQLRVYLRVEMDSLIHFFNEFPGTIAPKLQMIFGALHLARDELLWYFRHHDFVHKGKKQILKPDMRITDLIYLTYRLDDLVKFHKKSIQEYYLEYLLKQDIKMVEPIVKKFLEEQKVDAGIRRLLGIILEGLPDKTIGDNFEAIRLNWYRASAALGNASSGIKTQETARVSQAMLRIVTHTRNVDCVDTQLRTHGSFKQLYWYRNLLEQMLSQCLKGQGNARNCLSLVQCLGHALDNVHRICPEEQSIIGKASVTLADQYLKTIVIGVEQLLMSIVRSISELRSQTGYDSVIHRLVKGSNEGALPGHESRIATAPETSRLRSWKRALGQICASIQEVEKIVVYNIEFCPREYLYESISRVIRQSLRAACLTGKEGKDIQRPTIALAKFKDVLHAVQNIETYLSVDLSVMVREVLLSEFMDPRCGIVGTSIHKEGRADGKDQKMTMIHKYAASFKAIFKNFLADQGVVYSPARQAFFGMKVAKAGGPEQVHWEAETKTDFNEMRALARLIGPYGVRVLEKELLHVVEGSVGTIKEILSRVAPVLAPLRGKFYQRDMWLTARKRVPDSDLEALLNRSTIIGCVLVFRHLLRQALQDVTESAVPFIFSTVKLATDHLHDLVKVAPQSFAPLDLLAADCGFDVGENDHALNEQLLKYKTSAVDLEHWSFLPELYAMSLSCGKWRTAKYTIEYEGFTTNAHTMVWCIRALIVAFHSIPAGSSVPESSVPLTQRIQADFENLMHCCAYSLLHNGRAMEKDAIRAGTEKQTQEAMVFLEQFILGSRGRLQLSAMEELFPFTLLRTNFIRIYEQQTKKGRRYAIEDDEKEGQ